MVSQIALGAIWGYQRWISPHKGFRCAHSVLHGGTGCSGYAKHTIRDHGFWGALPLIRQRFRDCREASATLRANCAVHSQMHDEEAGSGEDGRPRGKKRTRKRDHACDALDCGEGCFSLAFLPAFCASAAGAQETPPTLPDKAPSGGGGPDAAPDASGCDLGGMDCAAPSCDGCSGCDCAPSCG